MSAFWFANALLPSGWEREVRITVADGEITSIQLAAAAQSDDERHTIALPGLANVHSHAFQRGMAGLSECSDGNGHDNFWSWREIMYRFLDRLSPDNVEAVAAMAYAEMLESGFTHVGEFHYLHHDTHGAAYANPAEMASRIASAARETGIGLTLLPVFYAHSNFGEEPPTRSQRRFINDIEGFTRLYDACRSMLSDGDRLGIAPHSLRAVSSAQLTDLIALCSGGPIHIHAAEQHKEVQDCLAWSGKRPVEWLLNHADLDDRWCLIHATHITVAETEALATSGAVAGLCPITEANLGDGIFPARHFLKSGGQFGIGTDSNILIDPAQELRAMEYGQRLAYEARTILASDTYPSVARRLFEVALHGGARAVAINPGLAVGHAADFVTLNAAHRALIGRTEDQWLDNWVFTARSGCIDTVWKRGRKLVSDGVHKDMAQIVARYLRAIDTVLS